MLGGVFDVDGLRARLAQIDEMASVPGFWDSAGDGEVACIMRERAAAEAKVSSFCSVAAELDSLLQIFELLEDANDPMLSDVCSDLLDLRRSVNSMKFELFFSSDVDSKDCFIEVQSGTGGVESNDWVQMLLRMYARWATVWRKFEFEIVDKMEGEEVGVKSVVIKVVGPFAYGWAKNESGVHRLVRISPFDSNARRHTTFASVVVSPVLDRSIDIDIDDRDLRIDTYRASGAGGQHVNKTDSAVRILHVPSGVVVQCQNNRSQHRNKSEAIAMLKSKLYAIELKKLEEASSAERGSRAVIGWGSQRRSYVLQPYKLVKDLVSGHQSSDVDAVLDGDLDGFMQASLEAF